VTILCEPDRQRAAALVPALDGAVRTVASLPDVAMTMTADPAEKLIVIGRDVAQDEALSFIGQVRAERPDVAVILLRDAPDAGVLSAAANAGVQEVVATDNAQLLRDACQRVRLGQQQLADAELPAQAGHSAQIITVFSAKGGSGKTTVAINLAVALHDGGARHVCLVDLDLAFGDVAISLQLAPTRTLIDAVAMPPIDDDEERLSALLTEFRPGLDCLLAPVEPGDAEKVPATLVTELLDQLRQRYDYVVIDTPSQFSEHVLAALDSSHHHVLLTTPEVPALKNLRLTLDMLDLLSYSRGARSIVFNRSDAYGGLSAADVETAIKSPIAAHVPSSRDVPVSINQGVPIGLSKPDHPVSQAIRQLAAASIVGEPAVARRRFGLHSRKTRTRA
jgi:MinD-like ATPase involved in chromosome partitioning or flagellar assembly